MDQPLPDLRVQRFADLTPEVAYHLWALRSRVFVVEQSAVYLDLDGRDLDGTTWHVWCADSAGLPVATLRLLDDGGVWRVGRVATATEHRGRGLARAMMEEVLARHGDRVLVLDAQLPLQQWYAGFGFVVAGAPHADEDGVVHVPMRREAWPG